MSGLHDVDREDLRHPQGDVVALLDLAKPLYAFIERP
jgi:hypothetical protein